MKKGSMSLVTKIFIGLGLGVVAGLLLQDNVEFANTYICLLYTSHHQSAG